MENNEKRWHWIFNGMKFQFADEKFPFAVIRFVHEPGEELPMHKHDFIEFVLVLNGSATHKILVPGSGAHEFTIRKGDVFLMNPDEEHTYIVEEGNKLEILNINFHSSFLDGRLMQGDKEVKLMDFVYQQPLFPLDVRFGHILSLGDKEISLTMSYIDNILQELKEKELGYVQVISLHMTLIFTMLSRKYNRILKEHPGMYVDYLNGMSDIYRVIGYLEHHHADDINKDSLAKIACSSVRNLSRKFKDCTGETVIEYLHKLRIQKAQKYLTETDMKIIEISTAVGFNDISFFNKVFRKYSSMTPKEYRILNGVIENTRR